MSIKYKGFLYIAFTLLYASLFGLDTSDFLSYELFNSPDIIEINNINYRIWNDCKYLDSDVVVVENWGDWITEGTEKDSFLRFIIENNTDLSQWDSGFITGILDTIYNKTEKKVLIIQNSPFIFQNEGESIEKTYSYLLDIEKKVLYKFLHNRNVSDAGFNEDGSVWIKSRSFNYENGEYETFVERFTKDDMIVKAE